MSLLETETTDFRDIEWGSGLGRTAKVTLTGVDAARGTVLGRITASGLFTTALAAANDGSEAPLVILAEDADASGGDVDATVWIAGDFNGDLLTYGAGHTADTVRAALIGTPIFVRDTIDL